MFITLQYASLDDRVLSAVAHADGRSKTWVYMDLYNEFATSAQEKALDNTNLCDWLRERQSKGLDAWIHTDESGHLERAFFVMEGTQLFINIGFFNG